VIYCVIPPELADELFDKMVDYYKDNPNVTVIIDRRTGPDRRAGKKLGRDSAHRKALYSSLAGALIEHGRIKTTVAKAKAVKPFAEQMITLGKRGDLHARRLALAELRSQDVVHQLFADVAPRFADRPGGYTRIVKLEPRRPRYRQVLADGERMRQAFLQRLDKRQKEET